MQQLGYKPKEFKTWAEAFFHCRRERDLSITEISRRVGESRRTVQDWEDGVSYPKKGNTSVRLYGSMHNLKAYKKLLPKELQDDPEPQDIRQQIATGLSKAPVIGTAMGVAFEKADTMAAEAEALAAEAAEPVLARPHKYNEALTIEREKAGLSKREVAELVDVGPTSITNWETGNTVPIVEHWTKLVSLFPELKFWAPPSREMQKPGRETGAWTGINGAQPVARPAPPPPFLPVPPPPPPKPTSEPTLVDVATSYAIARVKETAAKAEVAKFEERLIMMELQRDEAKKAAEDATAEAEAAHARLIELATR